MDCVFLNLVLKTFVVVVDLNNLKIRIKLAHTVFLTEHTLKFKEHIHRHYLCVRRD